MNHIKSILFDLDGTLTDPRIGITKSVQYSLTKLGISEPELEKLIVFIGPPLRDSYKKYYGFSEDKTNEAVQYYREYYAGKGIFENEIYTGIKELLIALNERRSNLYVATSKPTVYSKRIAEHFTIIDYFKSVEGSELDGKKSDKAELIKYILDKYGIKNEETIMIGDREHDIIGARKKRYSINRCRLWIWIS